MKYQVEENCLTIFLPKEVDHHQAEEIKKEADAIIERSHINYGQLRDRGGHGKIPSGPSDRRRGMGSPCKRQDQKDSDDVRSYKNYADI